MKNKTFKLTAIAVAVLGAAQVNAALYKVVEVDPLNNGISSSPAINYSHGVAIQQGTVANSSAGSPAKGCFDSTAELSYCEGSYKLAGEALTYPEGFDHREEAPFGLDRGFIYISEKSDFKTYCNRWLGYNTCQYWADQYWPAYEMELNGDANANVRAFVESDGTSTLPADGYNTVINSLTDSAQPVGNRGIYSQTRDQAFAPNIADSDVESLYQSRAWKTDGTYTVGSISTNYTDRSYDGVYHYTSKAAIWDADGKATQIGWPSNNAQKSGYLAQGSIRDFVIDGTTIYGVGYNAYDGSNNYMDATIFKGSTGDITTGWTYDLRISGAQSDNNDFGNTLLTGVNKNFVAIGEAKRNKVESGAYPNKMFIVPDIRSSSPAASFFAGNLTFSAAGGEANAINNYNEIVGQVDLENTREQDGKARRKRAFIYPYSGNGTDATRLSVFNNQGWVLDNLTNGGDYSGNNNQYRILNATDINDAGVISATAIKCSGGYDSVAYNATCGGGNTDETTVAVKLVPIPGATSADISVRTEEQAKSSRSGGSLGWLGLGVLGLLGFRRRK